MARLRYQQALALALHDEMERNERVMVLGEDVRHALRGITRGLVGEFGTDRVMDCPISEQAFTGFAMGAAISGWRPVVEYQIPSLVYTAFEQIVNQAQKFSFMTGGQSKVPVTYLVPGSGARRGLAAQHSDNPYTFFVHAGVKSVLPATAEDAYGLLVSAIRDDDPVMVFAPAAALPMRSEVGTLEPVPLGRGRIHRPGHDVTLVATGHLVALALEVAERLEPTVSVEVFDPRSLLPFDWDLLAESLGRTGRLVVLDDSPRSAGLGGEIVATAAEEMRLVAPPRRVSRADAPIAFALPLEARALPDAEEVVAAVLGVMPRKVVHVGI